MGCHAASLASSVLTGLKPARYPSHLPLLLRQSSHHARSYASISSTTTSPAEPRDAPLHLVILGAPGAGKGTQTDSLLRKYPLKALTVGNLLREEVTRDSEVGKKAAAVMKAGGLVDDPTILEVVKPALKKLNGRDWILDGYPRTAQQAHDLNAALAEWKESINLVVQLDVPDECLLERIEARWVHMPSGRIYNTGFNPPKKAGYDDVTGEPLTKRVDDDPDIFRTRLKKYHAENAPILDFYHKSGALVTLTGRTSPEIWPKLEKVINDRHPHIQAKQ